MRLRCAAGRDTLIITNAIVIVILFVLYMRLAGSSGDAPPTVSYRYGLPQAAFDNLFLDDTQCRAAFPGLIGEIDSAVSEGDFDVEFSRGAVLNVKIKDGQVYLYLL